MTFSLLDARQMRGIRHLNGDKPSLAAIVFPLTAIAFAAAIFVVDTFTPLGIAVAALYVVVVLMAGRFLERRGVLVVASSCIALTSWLTRSSTAPPMARP
jgi:hypothetical protein